MAEDPAVRITQADAFLRHTSWDGTWTRIRVLLGKVLNGDAGQDDRTLAGGAAG
jgi:hypothetical protein